MTTIYTIGHSTRTQEELIQLLKLNNIDILVDIRSYPGSTKFPHFNKENMSVWLPANGIKYVHILKLGGRRNKIKDVDYNLVNAWEHPSFRNYAAYTLTNDYEEGIDELISLAEHNRVCYMCSEGYHKKCHRNLVSNTLFAMGIEVKHIVNQNEPRNHTITEFAHVCEGHVTYPSDQMNIFEFAKVK